MAKKLRKRFHCATEFTLAVLEGKWKCSILSCLAEHPRRYAQLRQLVPGLSDKMLSARLRELIDAGLVVREVTSGTRQVQTYALSPLGRTLQKVLTDLESWATQHAGAFGVQLGSLRTVTQGESGAPPCVEPAAGPSHACPAPRTFGGYTSSAQ